MILSMLVNLTLFLDIEDFTNRNRISVTALLCLTTLFGSLSIREDFPKTTEFKYVDLWFLWYLSNTFLINCYHVFIDKLSRFSNMNCLQVRISPGKPRKEVILSYLKSFWKFPKMINYIAVIFFFVTNVSFNIVYFSIATECTPPCRV